MAVSGGSAFPALAWHAVAVNVLDVSTTALAECRPEATEDRRQGHDDAVPLTAFTIPLFSIRWTSPSSRPAAR
jgi:hypothetical protein